MPSTAFVTSLKALLITCFCFVMSGVTGQEAARGAKVVGSARSAIPGRTWAVIVGISKYKNIQGLNFADRDAQSFYNYLVKTDGGPGLDPVNVKLLLNEDAQSIDIYGALDWLSESVKE